MKNKTKKNENAMLSNRQSIELQQEHVNQDMALTPIIQRLNLFCIILC